MRLVCLTLSVVSESISHSLHGLGQFSLKQGGNQKSWGA